MFTVILSRCSDIKGRPKIGPTRIAVEPAMGRNLTTRDQTSRIEADCDWNKFEQHRGATPVHNDI